MAKICIVSVGVLSQLQSSCEIARRLQAHGHELLMASVDPDVAGHLANTGLPFFQLSDDVPADLADELACTPPGKARWRLRKTVTRIRRESALRGQGIEALLRTESPDLLLVDSELHSIILYLQRHPVPIMLLEYHISVRRRSGIPPLDSHLLPSPPFVALRSALAWGRTLLLRRKKQLSELWHLRPCDARSVWKQLARDAGRTLSGLAKEDQWPLLFYPQIPRLNLFAPELDFSIPQNDGDCFVGPIILRQRDGMTGDEEVVACRAWLEQRDARRPLVVCAIGSILSLPAFTAGVIAAARDAPFDLLVAAGRRTESSALEQSLSNVRVMRFIPQLDALAQARLLISHGGIASIHESLFSGVPLLVYSGGVMDENGNGARIQFHGLGMSARMADENSSRIRCRIDSLLGDEGMLHRVRAMRSVLESYEREQCLEQCVDEMLAGGSSILAKRPAISGWRQCRAADKAPD